MVYSCARRVTPPSGTQGTRNRGQTNPKNALLATDGDQVVMEIQD